MFILNSGENDQTPILSTGLANSKRYDICQDNYKVFLYLAKVSGLVRKGLLW